MSEQNTTAVENAVLTDERGQYTVGRYSLKNTKQVMDRFKGDHVFTYRVPAIGEDLEQTLRNIRAVVAEDADFNAVLIGKFNGQGWHLDVQKKIQDFLGQGNVEALKDVSTEDALRMAQEMADAHRLTNVRTRSASPKQAGKVAQAEAKAAKAQQTAIGAYRLLPLDLRAQYRERLLALGGITAEEMDAADAEDRASAEAEGGHTAGGNKRSR